MEKLRTSQLTTGCWLSGSPTSPGGSDGLHRGVGRDAGRSRVHNSPCKESSSFRAGEKNPPKYDVGGDLQLILIQPGGT